MVKSIDLSKFRKDITKSIDNLTVGFNDPMDWISTGNYCLNYLLSGDFNKGIPLGKVTMLAGESGSGKSFLASGTMVKNAQEAGIFVVLIDTENALDEEWLRKLGVDTSEDKLMKLSAAMIDDVAKIISQFMKGYKDQYEGVDPSDRPKVLFVIDSLGMLLTPTDRDQFDKGDLKGDMGRKPKALNALVRNCVNMFGNWNVGLLATNHTYASQDMFNPDDKISGGCLTSGHNVIMWDGSIKSIDTVQVGDIVKTMNGDIPISKTFHFDDKEVFELELDDGSIIEATGEHKFLVSIDNGIKCWKTVYDLNEDDEILKII